MQDALDKHALLERKIEKECAREIAQRKSLFIYGKGGAGRFINESGVDILKTTDLILNANPKYTFIHEKLTKLLSKK